MTRKELAAFKRLDKRRDGLFSALCVIKTWLSLPEDREDTLYHIAKLVTERIAEMRGMGNYQRYSGDHARVLANRLEAAHKRERGDAAELREALVRVLDWLKRMNAQPLNTLAVSELTPSYAVNRTAKSIIEDNDYHISQLTAALATPSRNCDCFKTAAEAIDAYQDLTGDQLATDSGMKEWVEFAVWLFAPATEKEGCAK